MVRGQPRRSEVFLLFHNILAKRGYQFNSDDRIPRTRVSVRNGSLVLTESVLAPKSRMTANGPRVTDICWFMCMYPPKVTQVHYRCGDRGRLSDSSRSTLECPDRALSEGSSWCLHSVHRSP